MPRDHVVACFDWVPVQLLVGPGLVGRAPDAHAVGHEAFRPSRQPLVGLAVSHAAPALVALLVNHPESRFDLHSPPPFSARFEMSMMPEKQRTVTFRAPC